MENLVASMVSVVIIVQRNEGNCFSGFQAMCEFTPTIDDGFTDVGEAWKEAYTILSLMDKN